MSVYCTRWQCQSIGEHSDHEKRVAYRGMLEAVVSHGKNLPRRALRRLKVTSIENYAKAVATNLNGKSIFHYYHKLCGTSSCQKKKKNQTDTYTFILQILKLNVGC